MNTPTEGNRPTYDQRRDKADGCGARHLGRISAGKLKPGDSAPCFFANFNGRRCDLRGIVVVADIGGSPQPKIAVQEPCGIIRPVETCPMSQDDYYEGRPFTPVQTN